MVNLDAIKYWICTTRAPCLYEYDQVSQRYVNDASRNCESERSCISLKEDIIVTPSRKKQKRKLLTNLTSSSSSNRNFVFFEKSSRTNNKNATFISDESELMKNYLNVKSDKEGAVQVSHSDKDIFHCTNISKINRNKEYNIITSTPINNKNALNRNKLNPFNSKVISSKLINNKGETNQKTSANKIFHDTSQRIHGKSIGKLINIRHSRNKIQNSIFDDISDVSGFTANYIRSTKLMSAKYKRHILKTRKISSKFDSNCKRNNITKESLNQISNIHAHSKSSIKKSNKSVPKNGISERANINRHNNVNSFTNLTVCESSIDKIDQSSKLRSYEKDYHSSSEDESIFGQRSRCNHKNKSLQRKRRRLQNTPEEQKSLNMKGKVEKQAGTMFYKPKKSILGQSNRKEADNSCATMNNVKSIEKNNKRNQSKYKKKINIQSIINRENGVINKRHSAVSQNETKSRNKTNIYFSDCESDISSEKHMYFG